MSNMKKTLVRAKVGVKLERIEHLAARQKREVCFKLSSHRNTPERMITERMRRNELLSVRSPVRWKTRSCRV